MAKQKILLVDSDEKSLSMMTISLNKADFNVTAAHDGEEAWELILTSRPDLIISDTKMPRMDGFALCRKIKDTPKLRAVPFIFLTREKSVDDKIRGLELGVDDYLTKPIYLKEVLARVRLLLEKREKKQGAAEPVPQESQFAGSLADMGVVDLIQTMEMGQKTGIVHLIREDFEASVVFDNGRVIDATAGNARGENAVYKLLIWNDGTFRIEFRSVDDIEPTVSISTQGMIMEGMRRIDELVRIKEQLPTLDTFLAIDSEIILEEHPDQFPEKIENILSEFTGKQSIQQVVDALPYDELETLEIIAKLYFQGFLMPVKGAPVEQAILASDSDTPRNEEPLFDFAPPEVDDSDMDFGEMNTLSEESSSEPVETDATAMQPPEEAEPDDSPGPEEEPKTSTPESSPQDQTAAPADSAPSAPRKAKPKKGRKIVFKDSEPKGKAAPPAASTSEAQPSPTPSAAKQEESDAPSSTSTNAAAKTAATLADTEADTAGTDAPAPSQVPAGKRKETLKTQKRVTPPPSPQQVAPEGPQRTPPVKRNGLPMFFLAAVLVLALGGGGFYLLQGGMLSSNDGLQYRDATIRLSGEELDFYRGASLHMDLDTASGYRRAIQGFETLATETNGWYATDQEIVLSKLILSYARLSSIQSADTGLNKALELAEAYRMERPDSVYLVLAEAETRIRSGDASRARELLGRFDDSIESFYLYHYIQGLLRLRENVTDLAIRSLRRSIELSDDFARGHFELARAYEASRRHSDAISQYEKVIKKSPNHAPAHYQLALIALARNKPEAALKHVETAAAVDESHLHAQLLLARLQFQNDNHRAAKQQVDKLLDLARPGRHDELLLGAHRLRGDLALADEDASGAERHYELALQIAPHDAEATAGLARAEELREAQQPSPRTARAPSPSPPPRQAAAPAPARQPETHTAAAGAEQAAEALEQARTYYRRGMLRDAAASLQEAVTHEPENDEAWALLGQIYIEADRESQALRALQRAISLNARNADAHVNLGGLYDAMGETDQANRSYRRYLEIAPEGNYANDIRSMLAGRE